jgi:beta-glucuronidase
MEQQLEIYGSKPYVAGAIYFCLNDYRTQRSVDYSKGYPIRDHGVCDGYQNPKKSYETLKKISSPVEVKAIEKTSGKILITLRGKTGIPSYVLRNYTFATENEKMAIDELKPGEEKVLELKPNSHWFSISRPTGFEVLRQNF